jgi:cytidine deaminase
MRIHGIDERDRELIAAARACIDLAERPGRHSVAAAVRTGSGRIVTGVNVETCGYGPCAEPVALGAAVAAGEKDVEAVVAVCRASKGHQVLPPCGNCRQLLLEYCPDAWVILPEEHGPEKVRARDLLPRAYRDLDEA